MTCNIFLRSHCWVGVMIAVTFGVISGCSRNYERLYAEENIRQAFSPERMVLEMNNELKKRATQDEVLDWFNGVASRYCEVTSRTGFIKTIESNDVPIPSWFTQIASPDIPKLTVRSEIGGHCRVSVLWGGGRGWQGFCYLIDGQLDTNAWTIEPFCQSVFSVVSREPLP